MRELIRLDLTPRLARITLDRPAKLNAFGDDMREQLVAALDRVAAAPGLNVLVVAGAGRAFCAGGDVHDMAALRDRAAGFEAIASLLELGRAIVTRIASLPFPTLAAVNGVAAGSGLNLALACDLRFASDQATFAESFVRLGLHPDWGGTYYLPRRVGLAKAQELCWTGEAIGAEEALRIGLVDRVIPHARFEAEVAEFAERLAAAPQASVRRIKRTLRASGEIPLDRAIEAEGAAQADCWVSADVAEGLRAFVEKRAPRFAGHDTDERAAWAAARRFE